MWSGEAGSCGPGVLRGGSGGRRVVAALRLYWVLRTALPSSRGWTDSSGSMESLDAELNLHLCVPDLGFFSAAGLIPWLKVMAKTG